MSNTNISSSLNASLAKIVSVIVVPLVSLVFVFAVLVFIWGVAGIIIHREDPERLATGRQHMIWGIVGIFIMIGFYGIIRIIANTLGVASPV